MTPLVYLMAASKKTELQVTEIVQALPCSYEYAWRFYSVFCRFPLYNECLYITEAVIQDYHRLSLGDSETKSTDFLTFQKGNINGKV